MFLLLLTFIATVLIFHKLGYLDRISFYRDLKRKIVLFKTLGSTSAILFGMMKIMASNNSNGDNLSLHPNKKNANVTYIYGQKNYKIYVPYCSDLALVMSEFRVFLHIGNEKIDITQQPGTYYSCTAHQMGGTHIEFVKSDGSKIIFETHDNVNHDLIKSSAKLVLFDE